MSKIICDVCGTRYPESAEQCPICGCVHAAGAKAAADSIILEEVRGESYEKVRGGRFSKANVRKRNKNMVRYEMQAEKAAAAAGEGAVSRKSRGGSNALLNFLLVVVILALLAVTGYIFVQHFLPDILANAEETTAPTEIETEAPTEEPTEEPTIPCTGLVLENGSTEVELTEIGQTWLLNVAAVPEGCTDELSYISSDESIVTVDAQGCITAVAPGEAVVTVACGSQQMEFSVSCTIVEETEPVVTEAPTEAPTEPLKTVELVIDKMDMTFREYGQQVYLHPQNGLTAQEVTWKSQNESIITVDENGLVTCVGWGTTHIIATYGDQEVSIICRCVGSTTTTTTTTNPTEGTEAAGDAGDTTVESGDTATESGDTSVESGDTATDTGAAEDISSGEDVSSGEDASSGGDTAADAG